MSLLIRPRMAGKSIIDIAPNVPRVGDAALARCAEPPYEARPSTAAKRGAQALTRC